MSQSIEDLIAEAEGRIKEGVRQGAKDLPQDPPA